MFCDPSCASGEVVALLGANGAGKSTTLRTISGLGRPRTGEIRFLGERIDGLPSSRIVRLGVAHSPEGRRLFGSLTVAENLRITRRPTAPADHDAGIDPLDLFPELASRLRQRAGTLSGGEQQMLACARALMANPDLLLMDEPSEGLAPQKVQELGALLERLTASGIAILLIEQNMRFALRYCDHVYVMDRGRIGFEGAPETLLKDTDAQERLLAVGSAKQPRATAE